MKYTEILALNRKPILPFSSEDVITNPLYAEKMVKQWNTFPFKKEMAQALEYYKGKNTFIDKWKRTGLFAVKGGSSMADNGKQYDMINHEDIYKSEIKMKNPFFQDMIDQIAELLLANTPTFKMNQSEDESKEEDNEVLKFIEDLIAKHDLGSLWKTQLKEMTIKAFTGTNFRIENSNVKVEPSPAETFGFFFDKMTSQSPTLYFLDNTMEGQFLDQATGKWKTMKVKKYVIITQEKIVEHSFNPETKEWTTIDLGFKTITSATKEDGEVVVLEEGIFKPACIPFAMMATPTLESYLNSVKTIIDAADMSSTDSMTELINLIKNLWVLKGESSTSASELKSAIDAGLMTIDETGDVKNLEGKEATDARIKKHDELREDFYRFAKVIDLEKFNSLSNTSGVSLRAIYEPIVQKTNDLKQELSSYIIDFVKKAWMMQKMVEDESQLDDKFDDLIVEFDKSILVNEPEELAANVLQTGRVSEKTRLLNHPWFKGASDKTIEDELKAMGVVVDDPIQDDAALATAKADEEKEEQPE